MIKMVCSDLDGTLLQYGKKLIEGEIFDEIRALHDRGILFCPASGRQYTSLRKLFAPVADDCIYLCENGRGCLPRWQSNRQNADAPAPWQKKSPGISGTTPRT